MSCRLLCECCLFNCSRISESCLTLATHMQSIWALFYHFSPCPIKCSENTSRQRTVQLFSLIFVIAMSHMCCISYLRHHVDYMKRTRESFKIFCYKSLINIHARTNKMHDLQ
ncbi:unnamed protein product [Albugo candida]|uniref:Uncharacterized protein n=1 Tax=Albugo candida TaxID=65357 RepID=A0A024FYF4_9STRA|nr:unnamed protein product [Albugo candida]|eukprot:CCI39427.1 unnamed protein product [Albugo candida]